MLRGPAAGPRPRRLRDRPPAFVPHRARVGPYHRGVGGGGVVAGVERSPGAGMVTGQLGPPPTRGDRYMPYHGGGGRDGRTGSPKSRTGEP